MSSRPERILIIDDEAGFTRLLKMNLDRTGRYLARSENDPGRALATALDFRPDLILLDVMMPRIDGGDLARIFAETPQLRRVPIIFLTGTVRRCEADFHKGVIGGLESKLVVRAEVTDASVHGSQALAAVTREGDGPTWLDAGYTGPACADVLKRKKLKGHVCEKGARNRPLTRKQKRSNRAKSRKRSRVEHVLGFMTGSMRAMYKRYIGYARNSASIIFCNLVYNMARTEQIVRLKLLGRATPKLGWSLKIWEWHAERKRQTGFICGNDGGKMSQARTARG